MLFARPDTVRRQWFSDARDDGRRMEVSWHADEAIVIVSLWHGSVCRATFRMPVEEAPGLIETLADALGDAVRVAPPSSRTPQDPARQGAKTSLLRMGRERLKRHVAEIVALERPAKPESDQGH